MNKKYKILNIVEGGKSNFYIKKRNFIFLYRYIQNKDDSAFDKFIITLIFSFVLYLGVALLLYNFLDISIYWKEIFFCERLFMWFINDLFSPKMFVTEQEALFFIKNDIEKTSVKKVHNSTILVDFNPDTNEIKISK